MNRARRTGRTRQAGLSLIEVLVSILIFSIGILGMVGLQARAVQYSVDAEDRTRAALLANEIVSEMWAQQTLTLPAARVTAFETRAQTAADPLYLAPTADVDVSAPAAGVVTVTITWRSGATKRTADTQDSRYITQVAMP